MTKAEKAFLSQLRRRTAILAPDLRRRYLSAFRLLREQIRPSVFARAIETGTIEQLISEQLGDAQLDGLLRPLELQIDRTALRAGEIATKDLPHRFQFGQFDILNPQVVSAARTMSGRAIMRFKGEIRETVREAITDGLAEGLGPRTIARDLRATIGMAPNQAQAVRNFNRMLREGDDELFTRVLRDRRFDRTIRKAFGPNGQGLTPAQIESMTNAYRRRMIAHAAETEARTLTLQALKVGQRLTWIDAAERGIVNPADLRREWLAVGGPDGDGRNRPEHLELHGDVVGFNEPFANGQMVPGESDYNCRCRARVFTVTGSEAGDTTPPRPQVTAPAPAPAPAPTPTDTRLSPVPTFATKAEAKAFAVRHFADVVDDDFIANTPLKKLQDIFAGLHTTLSPHGLRVNQIGFIQSRSRRRGVAMFRRQDETVDGVVVRTRTSILYRKSAIREGQIKSQEETRRGFEKQKIRTIAKQEARRLSGDVVGTREAHRIRAAHVSKRWTVDTSVGANRLETISAHEASHAVYYSAESYRKNFIGNLWESALKDMGVGREKIWHESPVDWFRVSEYGASSFSELWAETGALVNTGRAGEVPVKILQAYEKVIKQLVGGL